MKLCQTVFFWNSFKFEAIHEATLVLPLAGWSHKNVASNVFQTFFAKRFSNVIVTQLHQEELFCQTFFKTASASPEKLLHWRSYFTSCFKRSWSYAKRGQPAHMSGLVIPLWQQETQAETYPRNKPIIRNIPCVQISYMRQLFSVNAASYPHPPQTCTKLISIKICEKSKGTHLSHNLPMQNN